MLYNFKLKMQPQAVPVSYFSILTKPTSRKIVASSDLTTDPSAGPNFEEAIDQGFRGPSKHNPHISRLRTQTQFFTRLIYDLEPDIAEPTIVRFSYNLIWLLIRQPVLVLEG